MKRANIFLLTGFFLSLALSYTYFLSVQKKYESITSFEECLSAGFPLIASYPESCKIPGKVFVNPKQEKEKGKEEVVFVEDFRDGTYFFEGAPVLFSKGEGILPPNLLLKRATTTLALLEEPVLLYDINNDKIEDIIFLVKNNDIPSYYISTSLLLSTRIVGTNALYVDDTVKEPALQYKNGEIYLTYRNAKDTPVIRRYNFLGDTLQELR